MANPVGMSDLFPYMQILYALAILAVAIPSPAHFKAGNPGVIIFSCWLLSTLIILLTNSIIWRGNIRNPAPIWCDITQVWLVLASIGYEASILCITRQLWKLSKAEAVIITKSQKRRDLIIDLCIGVGVPILIGVGHGIVQGHRYDVYEDIGCWTTTYNVTLAYPLYFIWPLVLSIISCVYGLLALAQFLKRRKSFETLLSSTSSGMQKNRYLRLMWLCSIDLMICIPFFTYALVSNVVDSRVDPWVSWEVTQADWHRVDFYRRILIDSVPTLRIYFIVYMVANCGLAFLFLFLFGFTRETKKLYVNAYYWALKPFGVKRPQRTAQISRGPRKRTWLDKLLRRDAVPLNSSFESTTGSMPRFASQSKSIPSSRTKSSTTSETDTLNWEDESKVMIIDGKRLTIPGLNGMASFKSEDLYDNNKKGDATSSPTKEDGKPFQSPV